MVIEKEQNLERSYDIYSRLLKERIIFVTSEIETEMSNIIIAQLLYLQHEDPKKEIQMYINSPGGQVSATLAILDTMEYITAPVSTICIGMAASGAAVLLSAGEKGRRFALPNSEIMIHQPLSRGIGGQASDIEISAKQILKSKKLLNTILAKNTKKTVTQLEKDTDRDHWLDTKEAVAYGIVDKIISKC